jgi:hypothetical protein
VSVRPTERAPPGVVDLNDRSAPDFLDSAPIVLLAFLDQEDELSLRVRHRLATVGARTHVPVGIVDTSRPSHVADAFGVKTAPMLLLFLNGEIVDRIIGVPPEDIIEETVRGRMRG